MGRIEDGVTCVHRDLNGRMEWEHGDISNRMEWEHGEIKDAVYEIQTRQEQELDLQKRIRDTVPDAGMLKDGIEKLYREYAQLRESVSGLSKEVSMLQEKNQKLIKEIRRERNRSQAFEL